MRVPRQLLREQIVVEDYAGAGARGPVYAAARTVRASVQQTSRLMIDERGRQLTIDALVIVRPEDGPVRPESRIAWAGSTFRVERAYPMPDSRRPSHWELALTRLAG